jgi:hypothetical protein
VAFAWASGCDASSAADACPGGACHGERTLTWQLQTYVPYDMDILFVIDDGAAGATLLPTVAASYPLMAQELQSITPPGIVLVPGRAPPSLHVGFVAASYAASAACAPAAIRSAACGVAASDQFLASAPCGQQPNFNGSWEDAFACMARFGVTSCATSQPLAAMRRALGGDAQGGGLSGRSPFLRASAVLQVVIVAAQDDASGSASAPADVGSFVALLKALKGDPDRVMVSVIGPSSSCVSDARPATTAPRLTALVGAFGSHGLYVPSCSDSPLAALMELTSQLAILTAPPCLGGVRDNDLALDGVQPTCAVEDRSEQLDGSFTDAVLPSCATVDSPGPCWGLDANPTFCPAGLLLNVHRGASGCPELSTITRVSCVGCLDAHDPACMLVR